MSAGKEAKGKEPTKTGAPATREDATDSEGQLVASIDAGIRYFSNRR